VLALGVGWVFEFVCLSSVKAKFFLQRIQKIHYTTSRGCMGGIDTGRESAK